MEQTSAATGQEFSADSYQFTELSSIRSIISVDPVSTSWADCTTSSAYMISGNQILTGPGCRATFTVRGTQDVCIDPVTVELSIATSPLDAVNTYPPNVLMILDNSSTMVEDLDGGVAAACPPGPTADCLAGAASPLSKSEMMREVGRSLVNTYMGRVNLGLMAYQQPEYVAQHWPLDSSEYNTQITSDDGAVVRGILVDQFLDVSYNPANYDPDFSGVPWDDTRKRYRHPNPSDPGTYFYYNVRIPATMYSLSSTYDYVSPRFSITSEPGNGWMHHSFEHDSYFTKTGTSDGIAGYSNYDGPTTSGLTDHQLARGIPNNGRQFVVIPYNELEWGASRARGLGYLHTPILPLDAAHSERLLKKLAPQHQNYSATLTTDPEEPVIAAGGTPFEGTILTARDYFLNQTNYFDADQGRDNAVYPLPEACDRSVIWLTDGMPSVNRDAIPYIGDNATALADAVAAVEHFRAETDAKVYTVGFSMPSLLAEDALHQLATAGGTQQAYVADRPEDLNQALTSIFDGIISGSSLTSTAAAVSSSMLQVDSLTYLSAYRSADWSGELKALELNPDGTYGAVEWDAEEHLRNTDPASRTIVTMNRETLSGHAVPVSLDYTQLSNAQRSALDHAFNGTKDGKGTERVAWLRGEEQPGLRSRVHPEDGLRLLGDIVHSAPQFVGKRNFGYGVLAGSEGAGYGAFRLDPTYQNRRDALYVGANNGMLHAFDAHSGDELFAYMPSELLLAGNTGPAAHINALMETNYTHRYYVDGMVAVGDAYLQDAWSTVLVGSMGAGGRTVFALDVTDPSGFSQDKVLWEFTHPDLGYNVGQPQIVRMRNGDWAAVFGNGYNSAHHRAALFVVRLHDGELLAKIDTGSGDPGQPNGLASPSISDWPLMDLNARLIHAGDFNGQMWRFDVSSSNPADWEASSNRGVLFQARDADNTPQPITSRPVVARHPKDHNTLIVLFGTGSYFLDQDRLSHSPQVQSLYGILETAAGSTVSGRHNLLRQEIVSQQDVTVFGPGGTTQTFSGRQISDNPMSNDYQGWYLDLVYNGVREGERVIVKPQLVGNQDERIRFSTLSVVPGTNLCAPLQRVGRIADLQLATGARNNRVVFDLNQDGVVDQADNVTDASDMISWGSGGQYGSVRKDNNVEVLLGNGDGPPLVTDPGNSPLGRQSWQQLR